MYWDVLLIFFVLGVVVPWRGHARMQHLLAKPQVSSSERILLYLGTLGFQWFAAAVAAWRASAHGWTRSELGLTLGGERNLVVGGILGAVILGLMQTFNLRRISRLPLTTRGRLQALAERILPQTSWEMALFALLALTAGCCEEFLYRGFAITALSRAGWPLWSTILASSGLFGLGHMYQGRREAVGTAILGIAFGIARTVYGSIVPVVLWHAAVDLVAGTAGPKYLARKTAESPETTRAI